MDQQFTDPDDPLSLLIVTDKLLTGFDAPVERAMYLDRPLRRHTLFQAITRTNRRFTHPRTGQEKRHGLVVDYVGLGNHIAQALKAADPDTGGKRPVEVDGLVAEFQATMARTLTRFAGVGPLRPLLRGPPGGHRAPGGLPGQGPPTPGTSRPCRRSGSSSTRTRP